VHHDSGGRITQLLEHTLISCDDAPAPQKKIGGAVDPPRARSSPDRTIEPPPEDKA
jgi:hypothetical protein